MYDCHTILFVELSYFSGVGDVDNSDCVNV